MHSVATFSAGFLEASRDEDEDAGAGSSFCWACSSSCCWANSLLNSATFGFSLFAGVPVRVPDRVEVYRRAFRLLPNGPVSSGGLRGLRVSLGRPMLAMRGNTK